jgi:hypothetical protein
MADNTDKTDDTVKTDEFYDDPETMGIDTSKEIAKRDDVGAPGEVVADSKYPLTPERSDYDLKHRGTLSDVEDGTRAPGGEDHQVREGAYEPVNDQEANIDTSDEHDTTRG